MSECIFCQIIRKAPANIVYEDEQVVAFLSNHPVNVGHTLVVSTTHYENIYDIPEDEAVYLFKIVKRIAMPLKGQSTLREFGLYKTTVQLLGKWFFICMCILFL